MPTRFRAIVLAFLLLVPATARAQTPDAPTLLRGMVRRAADNVAGVRSYTLAYIAGPTRTLAHVARGAKGDWATRLQQGAESPVRTLIGGALDLAEIAHADTLDFPATGFLAVRADTAGGRLAYAVDINPGGDPGETGVESIVVLVDAETFDLVRVVTTGDRPGEKAGSGPPMVVWVDMVDFRRQSGVRVPGRYHVRGWNVVPGLSEEQRAEMLRQMQAERPAAAAGDSGSRRTCGCTRWGGG